MRFRVTLLSTVLITIGAAAAGSALFAQRSPDQNAQHDPYDPPGTFSVLCFDSETGEVGAAVQSRVFSVGNGVLWAEAGVGAVATQAVVNVGYGPQGMALLRQGMAPKDIVQKILADDPDADLARWPKAGRQLAVMNAKGEFAAHTGANAPQESGDFQGKSCTAQGNTLGRPDGVWPPADGFKPSKVPAAIVEGFDKSEKDAAGRRNHIATRLVAALEGGQAAGGDRRGQQSAALIVVKKGCGVWPNNDTVFRLQVDDNPEPIKELRRLVEKALASRTGQAPCYKR
jgi:uncharacterized Ntn-hydrolase superfamily protein